MKKIGLFVAFILVASVITFAQRGGGGQRNFNPEEMAKRQTAELKTAVGLNLDQEKKVNDLFLSTSKQMQKLREEMGDNREGMREKSRSIREEQEKKLKEILTVDQFAKYEKFREERRGEGRPGGPGSNSGQGRPNRQNGSRN